VHGPVTRERVSRARRQRAPRRRVRARAAGSGAAALAAGPASPGHRARANGPAQQPARPFQTVSGAALSDRHGQAWVDPDARGCGASGRRRHGERAAHRAWGRCCGRARGGRRSGIRVAGTAHPRTAIAGGTCTRTTIRNHATRPTSRDRAIRGDSGTAAPSRATRTAQRRTHSAGLPGCTHALKICGFPSTGHEQTRSERSPGTGLARGGGSDRRIPADLEHVHSQRRRSDACRDHRCRVPCARGRHRGLFVWIWHDGTEADAGTGGAQRAGRAKQCPRRYWRARRRNRVRADDR
jgi:hypothetical protein